MTRETRPAISNTPRLVAAALAATLLLAATLSAAVPGSLAAPPTAPPRPIQALVLGDQQVIYTGDTPLSVEPGVYWDTSPATARVAVVVDDAGPHLLVEPGPTDEVRLIVQLDGEPVAVRKESLRTSEAIQGHTVALRAAQDEVLETLDARGIQVRMQRRYVYAYNGLSVTARAGDRKAIAETPGVRAVHPDRQIQALLPESVPLVGAPAVWAMTDTGGQPVTGAGVRVAVVDTGIDYDHPDLGGPGFPNTRVITGYDFVADNADPWDDWGHGTHVAGIVGASGGVTGVAPGASLMAYKVVNAETGHAETSDTIAAIERALDPDGDPGTDDGAHVINISLGDLGHPDDPLSQACDNAVTAGAVVVAGAGNSGPYYQSITSPGVARKAIGVGATTKADALWTFSSRGPGPAGWAIKPDLVAPGVNISSTIPGGYTYGTGTSSSTPHVAGAAALLRQLHPAWSPEQVQAALMNTALDLGRNPFEQGAGRLQVDQAAATPALVLPPSLRLGRVDPAQPIWTHQEALTVENASTATVTYTLSIVGSFPAGVTRAVSPAQVAVGPGSSAPVTLTVTVDTATVPDQTTDPFAYWGAVRAVPIGHAAPALRVPFAFLKAPLLRLHVDEAPISAMFLRHGDPLVSRYVAPATTTSDHLLTAGTYDVVVQYQQPYAYVLQTIELTQTAEVTLARAAAVHQVRIAFTDENDQTVAPTHAFHRFMRGGNGWLVSESAATEPIAEVLWFSDVPATYVWERTVADADPTDVAYRQWHGRAEGVSGDLEFLTDPTDLARVDHPLRAVPGATAYTFWELIGYATPYYAYMVGPTPSTVPVPYVRRAYYRTPPSGHELYAVRLALPDPEPSLWEGAFQSPWLQLDADRHLTWQQPAGEMSPYYRVPAGGAEPLGLGPIHWFARFANDAPDSVRLAPSEGSRLFYRAYQGGDGSWELSQPYELWRDGALVQAGDVGADTGSSQVLVSLPVSGTYSMTLPFTYTLGATDGMTGHGRVVAVFDTRQAATDANPPVVEVLRVLEDGQPTDVVAGPAELRLVVTDAVDAAPVVSVDYDAGGGWAPVAVAKTGDEYTASLPGLVDGTAVRLRIAATDASGNVLTHILEPAYLVRWRRVYLPLALKGVSL